MRHLIYIPGLGGSSSLDWQQRLVNRKLKRGTKLHFLQPKWHTDEPYDQKIHRILGDVSKIPAEDEIVLVGVSAGGAMAVTVFGEYSSRINKMILVSGKLSGSHKLTPAHIARTPSLMSNVTASERILSVIPDKDTNRITVIRPLADSVVDLEDMLVAGAHRRRVPAVGHTFGIIVALIFYIK